MVRAVQTSNEASDLGGRAIAKSCLDQLQRRDPPLGPNRQVGQDVGFQSAPVRLGEELRGFGGSNRSSLVPSSATSPTARSLANGTEGCRRLANTIVRRSGARASSSRVMWRTSAASSTRWKSSRIRTAPLVAIVGSSRMKAVEHDLPPGIAAADLGQQAGRRRRECRIVLAACGDQMVQERDPVPVVIVEPIPQRPHPGPTGEVGQQGRLAVPGIGEDEDDPAMDLRVQPVQQPRPLEGFVAQRWTLDLGQLDREAVDLVAQRATPRRRGIRPPPRTYRDRRPLRYGAER